MFLLANYFIILFFLLRLLYSIYIYMSNLIIFYFIYILNFIIKIQNYSLIHFKLKQFVKKICYDKVYQFFEIIIILFYF